MPRGKELLERYVKPHNIKSRDVLDKDLPRVISESKIMYKLCYIPIGRFKGGKAMSHQQICKKDPLRFFVTAKNEVIINPVIIRHTKTTVKSKEGCLSFPNNSSIDVDRWHKCEVELSYLTEDNKISERGIVELSGEDSFILQHERDHCDCVYIFNIEKDE